MSLQVDASKISNQNETKNPVWLTLDLEGSWVVSELSNKWASPSIEGRVIEASSTHKSPSLNDKAELESGLVGSSVSRYRGEWACGG